MAALKPGILSSEFWLIVVIVVVGAALVLIKDTRDIGATLIGLGSAQAKDYLRARTELKKDTVAAIGAPPTEN